jgi:putative ABC transport system ATP-binding protein
MAFGERSSEMTLIELDAVDKTYSKGNVPVRALKEVNLRIQKGEFVYVSGASGSGKSTLLNIIGAVDWPTRGRYLFQGRDVTGIGDWAMARFRNRRVGFVFQSFNLLPNLTAWENVALPLYYGGIALKPRKARAIEALSALGLSARIDHYPGQLSGGEEQRVAFARAMVTEPDLLIADEPTGNLDTKAGEQILELMVETHSSGRTIILATHNPEVGRAAERRLVLADGIIVEDSAA